MVLERVLELHDISEVIEEHYLYKGIAWVEFRSRGRRGERRVYH